MLHSQLTGNTVIRTHKLHIQSPMRYPLGHHVSINQYMIWCPLAKLVIDYLVFNLVTDYWIGD